MKKKLFMWVKKNLNVLIWDICLNKNSVKVSKYKKWDSNQELLKEATIWSSAPAFGTLLLP